MASTFRQEHDIIQLNLTGSWPEKRAGTLKPGAGTVDTAIRIDFHGVFLEISNQARKRRSKYIPCTAKAVLIDLSGISKLYLITGRTDMKLYINGLMAVVRDTYQMDPYANAMYLFCGRRLDRLKALYHDKTGVVLLYMRLDCGRFQ